MGLFAAVFGPSAAQRSAQARLARERRVVHPADLQSLDKLLFDGCDDPDCSVVRRRLMAVSEIEELWYLRPSLFVSIASKRGESEAGIRLRALDAWIAEGKFSMPGALMTQHADARSTRR